MLTINCNREEYEYDIHSLVKSFFHEDEVIFQRDGEEGEVAFCIFFKENNQCDITMKYNETYHETYDLYDNNDNVKSRFKYFFYQFLSNYLKKSLPWGNLVGIRPTKIAMQMLEEGKAEEEIHSFLKSKHFVSTEKCNLGIDIAKREKEILGVLDYEKGYSLYIGIPFCPTTCLYCSFTSNPISKWSGRMDAYLSALEKELDYWARKYRDRKLNTVYIGGGTPTSLSPEQLYRLISKVKTKFNINYLSEFTVEAGRPDSITAEKLQVLYECGVSRISVNPQTMNAETLKRIGRCHTPEQTIEAFEMARRIGMDNINMDIILGLPGEDATMVQKTVDEIERLHPDSLTVHSLAIKRASRLSQWILENDISTIRNTDETMQIASKCAERMQMKPYYLYRQKNMSGNFENVGYASEGKFGIYNILIMEEKQTIAAVGAGSITKLVLPNGRIERSDNVKDVEQYLSRIDEMIVRRDNLLSIEE